MFNRVMIGSESNGGSPEEFTRIESVQGCEALVFPFGAMVPSADKTAVVYYPPYGSSLDERIANRGGEIARAADGLGMAGLLAVVSHYSHDGSDNNLWDAVTPATDEEKVQLAAFNQANEVLLSETSLVESSLGSSLYGSSCPVDLEDYRRGEFHNGNLPGGYYHTSAMSVLDGYPGVSEYPCNGTPWFNTAIYAGGPGGAEIATAAAQVTKYKYPGTQVKLHLNDQLSRMDGSAPAMPLLTAWAGLVSSGAAAQSQVFNRLVGFFRARADLRAFAKYAIDLTEVQDKLGGGGNTVIAHGSHQKGECSCYECCDVNLSRLVVSGQAR